MLVIRADQHAVPLPAAGRCRLDEHQHLALVQVRREPSEHPLGEEGRVPDESLEIDSLSNVFMRRVQGQNARWSAERQPDQLHCCPVETPSSHRSGISFARAPIASGHIPFRPRPSP